MAYPFSDAISTGSSGGFVYPAAGVCIYCGSVEGLSTEHIVPFGLFGDLLLPAGSCETCRKITSALESFVLQRMLGVHRRKLGYRSQSNKKRRNEIKVVIHRQKADGSETPIVLTKDQYPFHSWALPAYDDPALLRLGTIGDTCKNDHLQAAVGHQDALTLLEAAGGLSAVRMQAVYDPQKFMRFLAKIAYATALLGVGAFKPLLNKFITEGGPNPRVWVGGSLDAEPARPEIFEVALGITPRYDNVPFLCAKIRLLSYMGTPTYTVVVGEGFKGNFLALQNCAYAKSARISVMGSDGTPLFTAGF